MQHRRDTLAAQYRQAPPPPWAHDLGKPPADPATRAQWADAVASVAVWREAHAINDDNPLGPPLPPDHRDRVPRARAAIVATKAIELATGKTPDATRHVLHYRPDHSAPAPTPTHDHAPEMGR